MKKFILALPVLVLLSASCSMSRMAAVSSSKSAYVVRSGMFSTNMFACKAETPEKPVCTEVEEK
jgi:hypothetical protein